MSEKAKELPGGTWVKIKEDKRGTRHVDFYDEDPSNSHKESIHISIKDDGSGRIATQTGDEKREETDIRCYLTTACMRFYQEKFDDNCYELKVLRWFRDNFVSKQDIQEYYKLAPLIVQSIEMDNQTLMYNYLYDNLVDYCTSNIENGNYEEAYERYKETVMLLNNYYLTDTNKKVLKNS